MNINQLLLLWCCYNNVAVFFFHSQWKVNNVKIGLETYFDAFRRDLSNANVPIFANAILIFLLIKQTYPKNKKEEVNEGKTLKQWSLQQW